MHKIISVLGWALLIAAIGVILVGLVGVAMTQGVWAALQMMSPFNYVNFIVTVATLAPGFLLIVWGEKLRDRQHSRKLAE